MVLFSLLSLYTILKSLGKKKRVAELVKDEGNSSNKNLQKSPETELDEEVEESDENISTERETDHPPHISCGY